MPAKFSLQITEINFWAAFNWLSKVIHKCFSCDKCALWLVQKTCVTLSTNQIQNLFVIWSLSFLCVSCTVYSLGFCLLCVTSINSCVPYLLTKACREKLISNMFPPPEKGNGEYQLSSGTCDEKWKVHFRIQVYS